MSFSSLCDDLRVQCDQIKLNQVLRDEKVENYDRKTHWTKMGLACEALSKECTKMALAFSRPPLPSKKDTELLLRDIAQAADILLAWYKTFPLYEGKVLCKKLKLCIINIIEALLTFLTSYSDIKLKKKAQLISTGTIWENCDSFKNLPSDNIGAMLVELDSIYDIISDTLKEIKDELEGEEDAEWNDNEKQIVKACMGLLMAGKAVIKKIKGNCKTLDVNEQNVKESDDIVTVFEDLSPSVDELVSSLYPPIDKSLLDENVKKVSNILMKVVSYLRCSQLFSSPEHQSWIDFIEKGVSHNVTKYIEKVSILPT